MSKDFVPQAEPFNEIISIIDNARNRALKAVNTELIQMYWDVGKYLSNLCADARFGDKVISDVADFIRIQVKRGTSFLYEKKKRAPFSSQMTLLSNKTHFLFL